jgi:hypothetical protein
MCLRYSISCTLDLETRLSQCACNLFNAFRTKKFQEGRWTAFLKGTTRDKQNRQCAYDATLRCLPVTIVAVEKQ